jgi:hypothetical protein
MAMPSWFPDPMHRHELRWWDGDSWTAHVSDHGAPSEDPLFGSDPEHPGWGPPTVTPSTASPPAPPAVAVGPPPLPLTHAAPTAVAPLATAGTPPPTGTSRRPLLIVGGIVAVVAVGVGVFFATRGSGDSTSLGDATTVSVMPTAIATTTVISTVTSTGTTPASTSTQPEQVITTPETSAATTPPTTAPATPTTVALPTRTSAQLLAALSQRSGVPSTWQRQDNGDKNPTAHSSGSTCNGPNDQARAVDSGSTAGAHGPTYSLPNGGEFGVDAYSFDTAAAADAFLAASGKQAAKCVTSPVLHRMSEKELDMMVSSTYDNAVWTLSDSGSAHTVAKETSDHAILVSRAIGHVMKYNVKTFSYRSIELTHYERHGAVVLAFWRWGNNHYQGFTNYDSSWDFTPNNVELMRNVRLVRAGVLAALR